MFLYALDELFYVLGKLVLHDVNGQWVVGYEILALALLCCMERCNGRPINPHKMRGFASTMMDVVDEAPLERLAWVVYDRMLLPGKLPVLIGQHPIDKTLRGVNMLIYKGKGDSEHCPHASSVLSM